jgi:hypothetical protein
MRRNDESKGGLGNDTTVGGLSDRPARRKVPLVGSIAFMPMSILVQTLGMNGLSGELTVTLGDVAYGRIWLSGGEIIAAQCGAARREEAVYRILALESGRFRLESGAVGRPRTIHATTQTLVLEGMRRFDHLRRIATRLPDLDCPVRRTDRRAPHIGRPRRLWEAAAEEPTLRQLVDGQPDALAALETVAVLFEQGALTVSTPNENTPDPDLPISAQPVWIVPPPPAPAPRRVPHLFFAVAAGLALLASGAAAFGL